MLKPFRPLRVGGCHWRSLSGSHRDVCAIARGDPGIGVFLIRKGRVSLQWEDNIALYPSFTLGPGTIIGLPATLSSRAYSLAAEVTEDAELGFVTREDFLVLMKKRYEPLPRSYGSFGQRNCHVAYKEGQARDFYVS